MERLTERTAGGMLVKENRAEGALKTLYQCYGAEPVPCYTNCDEGYCAMETLAEYEDTGITPGQIREIDRLYAEKCKELAEYRKTQREYEDLEEQCVRENSWSLRMLLHKWKEFIDDIQELYEYRKLEEQGKLLKLPCAVGDTVYVIEVDEENFTHFHCPRKISEYKFNLQMLDLLGMFGKCIFLTREEAEAALKELRKAGNNE